MGVAYVNCLKHNKEMLAGLAWFSVNCRINPKASWFSQIHGLSSPIWKEKRKKNNKKTDCSFCLPRENSGSQKNGFSASYFKQNSYSLALLWSQHLHFMSGQSESLCFEQLIIVLWVCMVLKPLCVLGRGVEKESNNLCEDLLCYGYLCNYSSKPVFSPEAIIVHISASL